MQGLGCSPWSLEMSFLFFFSRSLFSFGPFTHMKVYLQDKYLEAGLSECWVGTFIICFKILFNLLTPSPIFPTPDCHLSPPLHPCRTVHLFSVSMSLVFFVCLFLDSTYRRGHTRKAFFSVCLISLSIMPSRSIHVAANGKISFFMAK